MVNHAEFNLKLEDYIQSEAGKLGFSAVGFARVGASQTFNRYQDWLSRGFAGEMGYLLKNASLRSHPVKVASGAESVIVVAARYLPVPYLGCDLSHAGGYAYFSTYAYGRDYHDVIRAKLRRLEQLIRQKLQSSLTARICVDSAPVLEREWAVRAGLGWIGRQGSLVNAEFGCCMFLGELFVDIELEDTLSIPNQCKDCRLCIDVCPTGAIQPDGFVDARRCISYLTIEHKGMIPEELRSLIGSSLFGCDRCTAICPWNQKSEENIMPEFDQPGIHLPLPEECLAMSERDFTRRFSGTAVYRTGLERLQRNAVIVLGNERRKSLVPMLKKSLKSPFRLVREHVPWALNQVNQA